MSPPFLQSWQLFSPHFEPTPHSPVPKPKLSFQVVSSLLTILALVAWWWVAACFHSAAHTVLTQLALVCMCALVYMCALGTWNLCTWHLCTWHLCTWHLCTCVLVSCRMFSFRCWYGVDTTVAPPSLYPSTSISPSLSITLKPAYYIGVRGSSHQKMWQMCQIRCLLLLLLLWHLDAADGLCHPRPPLSPSVALHHMLTAPSLCQITQVSNVQF